MKKSKYKLYQDDFELDKIYTATTVCFDCKGKISIDYKYCPHCGIELNFDNVNKQEVKEKFDI